MNNMLSYCGLVDAKIRASDIHLSVQNLDKQINICHIQLSTSNNFKIQIFHLEVEILFELVFTYFCPSL
jgi:hypothetical protein